MIEIFVYTTRTGGMEDNWHALDIGEAKGPVVEYVSTLLSDPSKFPSCRTYTLKLPRTRNNDDLMDLSVMPGRRTLRPYRYLPCRCYIDGVDLMGKAVLNITGSDAESYSVVITFGALQQYTDWLSSGKTLRDLTDSGEDIVWDQTSGVTTWYGSDACAYTPSASDPGFGKAMYYGVYNPGVNLSATVRNSCNIHPFVTVRELWERMLADNGLDINTDSTLELKMDNDAIVLTKPDANPPNAVYSSTEVSAGAGYLRTRSNTTYVRFWPIVSETAVYSTFDGMEIHGESSVMFSILECHFRLEWHGMANTMDQYLQRAGGIPDFVIVDSATGYEWRLHGFKANYQTIVYSGHASFPTVTDGQRIGIAYFEMPTEGWQSQTEAVEWTSEFAVKPYSANEAFDYVRYSAGDLYPGTFKMIKNLPDIKQVDFFRFVCRYYGYVPVTISSKDRPTLVYIKDIVQSGQGGKFYDWSEYLVDEDPDSPARTEYHLSDFARRNRIGWKEDPNDPVTDEAFIEVDDVTIGQQKDFCVFPFAATKGSRINQYRWVWDGENSGYIIEYNECEYRLMRVTQWDDGLGNPDILLRSSDEGHAQWIKDNEYQALEDIVRHPRVITETMRIPLAELKGLDLSRSVYLGKYGEYFLIVSLRYDSSTGVSEVKLIKS